MALNKVMLIGNLGADAEIRNVGQSSVASIRMALTEKFKDRDGNQQERTEWVTCELWNNNGVYQYLTKGQQVFVEGTLRTEEWNDNQGQKRFRTYVRVLSLQLLGSRNSTAAAPQQTQQYVQPAQQPQYPPQAPQQYAQPQPQYAPQGYAPTPQYAPQPQQAPAPQYAMPDPNSLP